jgi:hypothetical protein
MWEAKSGLQLQYNVVGSSKHRENERFFRHKGLVGRFDGIFVGLNRLFSLTAKKNSATFAVCKRSVHAISNIFIIPFHQVRILITSRN